MWRITPEGRKLLRSLAAKCGDRATFGAQVGIGKNQVKPILDASDHSISQNTCEKLRAFAASFKEGVHYVRQINSDGCEIRLVGHLACL